jgi:two-component system, chemotaxis family, protein-glutamate methylesterase/glutaminase
MSKIKVLIVDDSALVRQSLSAIFHTDPDIEITGIASDPYGAVKQIQKNTPDVITLDLQMPRMDGLTFLKKLMRQHPIPVVVISSLTTEGSRTALRALEYGAIQVLHKPTFSLNQVDPEQQMAICDAVKAASMAKLPAMRNVVQLTSGIDPLPEQYINTKLQPCKGNLNQQVVVIGASAGGTEALKVVLRGLPKEDVPGIVVVQHMPKGFTKLFAEGLNRSFPFHIKEAEDGDVVQCGQIIIAEGDHHLLLKKRGNQYIVSVNQGDLVNRHRPSVDVLFQSTAKVAGSCATGILLTGMGNDGAKGLLEMKEAGAYTMVQDEESSVVFGMPREAIRLNAADQVLPLDVIPTRLMQHVRKKLEKNNQNEQYGKE